MLLDMLLGAGIGYVVAIAFRAGEQRHWRNADRRFRKRRAKMLEREERRRRSLGYS